jgi:NTP pyrophosphatase (non-canonical NTP hydrolase)
MEIRKFQELMAKTYLKKDRARGTPATFMWFVEEVGELATALREGTLEEKKGEFADVYAWLMTLANLAEVDMQDALQKYGSGCCGCGTVPCSCVGQKP